MTRGAGVPLSARAVGASLSCEYPLLFARRRDLSGRKNQCGHLGSAARGHSAGGEQVRTDLRSKAQSGKPRRARGIRKKRSRSTISPAVLASRASAFGTAFVTLLGSMKWSRFSSTSAGAMTDHRAHLSPPNAAYSCSCEHPPCGKCDYLTWDRAHVLHPYTSMTDPLPTFAVAGAKGAHIELEDGRKLVDGMSSWWAAVHGYRHPIMDAAVSSQLESMSHVMFGGLTHRPGATLGRRLVELAPEGLNKVFLCDSGSVAVEVAMKMAVQYWFTVGQGQKSRFVSLRNGYHGDTFGAMSVCDPVGGMHSMFSGVLAQQDFVTAPDGPLPSAALRCAAQVEELLKSNSSEVAAVILEPVVQGAGGMRFYHPLLLRKLRDICDKHDVLLIFDEIATGFGRTGTFFACQQTNSTFKPWYSNPTKQESECESEIVQGTTVPDILCVGKALTGGYMTLGATLANDRIAHGISDKGGVFMHGPTFMGNPLACAAANASLDLLQPNGDTEQWHRRVQNVRDGLVRAFEPIGELPQVAETRVLGAIGVCELRDPVKDMATVQRAFVEQGVWLRPFGKLLYSMPPFNCPELGDDDIAKIGTAIYNVASKL